MKTCREPGCEADALPQRLRCAKHDHRPPPGEKPPRPSVFDGADWSAPHPIRPVVDVGRMVALFDAVAGELGDEDAARLRHLIRIGGTAVNLRKTEAAYGLRRELLIDSAREQLNAFHRQLTTYPDR